MRYDAKAIANFFLDLAEAESVRLSHMKLQKLVYYAHGWHLGLTGEPLLDEEVQAWSFGPVIRSLYSVFRQFGSDDITGRAAKYQRVPGRRLTFRKCQPSICDYEDESREFIEALLRRVWDVYKNYSATQLSNMTHAPGTPWDQVNRKYSGNIPKYATIPDDWIREHFEGQGRSSEQ
jgi:uncharacterized phage-associated protein